MNENEKTGVTPEQDTEMDSASDQSQGAADEPATGEHGALGASSIEEELANAKAEVMSLKDQLLRRAAEFENFRRRSEERQTDLVRYGNEKLITELLPVIDDFNRSLKAGKEHTDFEPFFAGVEMLYAKFLKILELRGLKPITAVGQPFDVDFHDALLQVPSNAHPPGTIMDEVETGYMLHDRVIRHSKVTVTMQPPGEEDGQSS